MTSNHPLVKLPHKIDYTLFLIKEELKSTRFFDGLNDVGAGDILLQPHLDGLILKAVGLDDGTDETFKFYLAVMQRRSRKIGDDGGSLVKQAMKVYVELRAEKRRRKMLARTGESSSE
jgi:hypothetical protein